MKTHDTAATKELPVTKSPATIKAITLSLVLAIGLYAGLFILTDSNELSAAIKSFPAALYLILIPLSLTSYLARFARWYLFLAPLQSSISIYRHAAIYLSGFSLTTSPGKAGEMIRSLYLYPLGVSYPASIAAFFSERLLDVMAVTVLAALGIQVFISSTSDNGNLSWFIAAAILTAVFFLLRSRLLSRFIQRATKKRLGAIATEFQAYVQQYLSSRILIGALPLSLFAWVLQGGSLFIVVTSLNATNNLGINAAEITLPIITGVYCLSILAGALSFIPGGIGATEASIALLLTGLGVDPSLAIAASIISRITTLWLAIAIGLFALISLQFTE